MKELVCERHEKQDGQMSGGWVAVEEVAAGRGARYLTQGYERRRLGRDRLTRDRDRELE